MVASPRRCWRAALFLLVPLAFGLYAVSRGRDANWDLQNYHWYDAYALLDWRYDRDVAPAHGMSFLVPYLYVPWFWLGNALPARALGFIIGAVQSVNLLQLYGLGLVMLPIERRLHREAVALMLAISSSRISAPAKEHNSIKRCQSAEFRAKRETSNPITRPALPRATSLTNF